MSLTTTASYDLVTCSVCGKDVRKRNACGVKLGGNAFVWTCVDCISARGMDEVFSPLGVIIRRTRHAIEEK